MTNSAGSESRNVYFRQSNDGGMTWSSQVQVNFDATTRLQWSPAIAVTPDGSRLALAKVLNFHPCMDANFDEPSTKFHEGS
jgi:hypothetical protein